MPRYHRFSDGTLVQFTPEEEAARDAEEAAEEAAMAAQADAQRVQNLYLACSAWENRPSDPHTCDAKFFAMLTGIKAVAISAQQPIGPKAAACLSWLDTLWADYYVRKDSGSTNYDFSMHGGCPHSFREVRQEAGM